MKNEEEFQRVVDEFYNVCTRRKMKVNAVKSKMMVFERREQEVDNFSTPYKMSVPAIGRSEVLLGERMEKMD